MEVISISILVVFEWLMFSTIARQFNRNKVLE